MSIDIQSYHAHIYFSPGPETITARALCQKAESEIGDRIQIGRFHEKPVGPHPRGSCQLLVGIEHSAEVLKWLMENRDGLTIFCHGNSGDNYLDHTALVCWLGESETLKLSIFKQ